MAERTTAGRTPRGGEVLRPAGRARGGEAAPREKNAAQGPSNQALQRALLAGVQPKLRVHAPDDAYEREADRIAEKVTGPAGGDVASISAAPPSVSRVQREDAAAAAAEKAPGEEEERKRRVEEMKVAEEEEKAQASESKEEEEASQEAQAEVAEEEKGEEGQGEEEAPEKKEEEPAPVQTRRDPGAVPRVTPELESRLAHPEPGRPLDPELRRTFEPRFGRDLGGVRLHTDGAAAQAARELDAHAFTRGRHIYFASGAYRPDTTTGRRLLAHELVHTQQQQPSPALRASSASGAEGPSTEPAVGTSAAAPSASPPAALPSPSPLQRVAVQRQGNEQQGNGGDGGGGEEPVDPSTLPLETGRLDTTSETITFSSVEVPGFKMADHRGGLYNGRNLLQKKAYARGNPDQRNFWKTQLGGSTQAVQTKLQEKLDTARANQPLEPGEQLVFQARTSRGAARYVLGADLAAVARELTLPSWSVDGAGHSYDVDHIVELQVAGWPADGWGNTMANMELLDSSTNRSSGSTVKDAIDKKVKSFIDVTHGEYGKSVATVKSKYDIAFQSATGGGGGGLAAKTDFWTQDHIRAGDHVEPVEVASPGALGGDGKVVVFPSAGGGQPKSFNDSGRLTAADRSWLKPYQIQEAQFDTEVGSQTNESLGSLTFTMPEGHPKYQPSGEGPINVPIARVPGARFAGSIDKQTVRRQLAKLRVKGASPVEIHEFDIEPEGGIRAVGQILPDVKILQGTGIDFELFGNDLTFSKTFAGPELQVPKPFEVKESTLTVSAGTRGAKVEGRADFAVENLGEGFLQASASSRGEFALGGGFDFDSELFQPAHIEAEYKDSKLTASGRIGVGPGKVKGVKSASLTVTYSEEEKRLHAIGDAELEIPGVKKGQLEVEYIEGQSLTIGGGFDISNEMPGVRGGRVDAKLEKGDGGWKLAASGNAQPDIPGFDTQLSASYDDGVFDLSARAAYGRGKASGTVQVGVTNRAVNEETGLPSGDGGSNLTLYGGGSVTLRLTPWLEATAGLRLLPDGSMEVKGKVALPSALQLFPEKKYEKNIFRIGLDIPIVGVAVAGQRIGIFATISGGLDLSAGIGPGELKELSLEVTYNPEHEEDTRVHGEAEVQVPAHAGLRLSVRGGLGAGIPVVSATAALEVGGALGLEGLARAGVQIDWTPDKGLVLEADGEVKVEPKFVFDVTGMVLVEADLLIDTIELYSKRWQLASFEWGPGLSFGIRFPVRYAEGESFDINWDQVEFDVPDIDAGQVLGGLIDRIA